MHMLQENIDVIAIFDIGKINKRFLLFDTWLNVVHSEERVIEEVMDSGGVTSEDITAIRRWMQSCLHTAELEGRYSVRAVNVTSDTGTLRSLGEHDNGVIVAGNAGSGLAAGGGTDETLASLVPYLKGTDKPFILISAGAWCKFINPFNDEQLTDEEKKNDQISLLTVNGRDIKLSQILLGIIHDMNVARLDDHFGVTGELYKTIRLSGKKAGRLISGRGGRVFFRSGVPGGFADHEADLSRFLTYADAYHQMVCDLVDVCLESYRLVISPNDTTEIIYVTGGFAWNDTFVRILAARLPVKRIYASRIDDPTALGAAMMVYDTAFGAGLPPVYLGLKAIIPGAD